MKKWRYGIIILIVVLMMLAIPVAAMTWASETVDSSTNGAGFAYTLDTNSNPYIGYIDTTNGNLIVASKNGASWTKVSYDSLPEYSEISVAVDKLGNPYFSYFDPTDKALKFAKWTGSVWEISTLDEGLWTEFPNYLVLDAAGNPHISWVYTPMIVPTSLNYIGLAGVDAVVAIFVSERSPTLAVDAAGNPSIIFFTSGGTDANGNRKDGLTPNSFYDAKWTGSAWDFSPLTFIGDYSSLAKDAPSLAIDAAGNSHIVYSGSNGLEYAKWTESAWDISTITSVGSGNQKSLLLDSVGNPHIVYFDGAALKYASENKAPVANSGQDQTVIISNPVTFDGSGSSDSDGTIVTYAWDFGDTNTGSGVSTSHLYTTAGTYTVTLTVTDNGGLTGSDTAVITVNAQTTNVPINVKIVPKTINLGSKGYFLAFVRLPEAYKCATIDMKTVSCSGSPAVRMMKLKIFPRRVGFVFKTSELNNVEVGKRVTLNVEGELNNMGSTYTFTGSDDVKVISKPSWQPDDIKDVSKVSDEQLFIKYST